MTTILSTPPVDVANDGERLVPGESHDAEEVVRHKSSYQFFRKIIEGDLIRQPDMLRSTIRILDIGCGSGHGTFMLSDILNLQITAIDPCEYAIEYAKRHYAAENIHYEVASGERFLETAPAFDYIVSRHALEHFEDGLNFALKYRCHKRLMVNVPFNESDGNIHHKVHRITESDFVHYTNKEFFYEDLAGITRLDRTEESPPNSIICVSTFFEGAADIRALFSYPIAPWQPDFLQHIGLTIKSEHQQLQQLQANHQQLQAEHQQLRSEHQQLQAEHQQLRAEHRLLSRSIIGRFRGFVNKMVAKLA